MESHREMGNMQSELAELNQANSAGDATLREMYEVIKNLKDAEHCSNWDMMNNQSTYYSQIKHNAINRAKNATQQAKHKLKL